MAIRNTGINLVVTGEKEFRDVLNSINAAYKVMNAQLKETASNFALNAGSMDAAQGYAAKLKDALELLDVKQGKIQAGLKNAQNELSRYIQALNNAQKAVQDNAAAMKETEEQLGENSEEYQKLAEKQKELEKAFADAQNGVEASEAAIRRWETELANTKTTINKTRAELNQTEEAMSSMAASAEEATEAAEEMGEATVTSVDAIASSMASARFEEMFDQLVNGLVDSAEAAIRWESAFAGVKKTVDADEWELDEIGAGLREMALDIPVAADELARIAEMAGQLGIEAGGILQFTETVANLAATTSLSAEEAAVSFARFANITKMSVDNYSNMGAAIVKLGNNLATTETEIVNMSMRIAAAGSAAGLSEPEILGIAAALSSLGLEAEMGGSAFSKAIKKIQVAVETNSEDLEKFAEVAGMTGEAFANLWNTNTAAAISQFIAGIGNVDENAQSIIVTMDELGLSEIRLSDTLSRLAGNSKILTDAIAMSNTAWLENTAMVEEASIRYETTESKMQLLKNAGEELRITFGEKLTPALNIGADGLTNITERVTEFIRESDGAAAVATGFTAAFGALAATAAIGTAIGAVLPALTAFITLGGGIPAVVMGVGAAITGLVAGVAVYEAGVEDVNDALDEHRDKLEDLQEQVKESGEAYQAATNGAKANSEALREQTEELQRLVEKERQTAADKAKIEAIVQKLNDSIPGLSLSYDDLSNSLSMNADEIEAWIDKAYKMEQMQAEFANLQTAEKNLKQAKENLTALREEYDASIARMEEYQKKAEEYYEREVQYRNTLQSTAANNMAGEKEKYIELIEKEKIIQQELLDTYREEAEVRKEAAKTVAESENKYNALAESIERTTEAQESAASSTEKLSGSMDIAAMSAEELKSAMQGIRDAYEEEAEGVEALGDALVDALREKHEQARDAELASLDAMIDGVEKKLDEETAAYEAAYEEREKFVTDLTEAAIAGIEEQIDLLEEMTAGSQSLLDSLNSEMNTQKKIGKISGYTSEIDSAFEAESLLNAFGEAYGATVEKYDRLSETALDAFGEKVGELGEGYREIFEQYKTDVDYIAERYAGEIARAGDEAAEMRDELAKLEREEASQKNYGEDKDKKKEYENLLKEIESLNKDIEKAEEDAADRRIELEEEAVNRQKALRLQMFVDLLEAAEKYTAEEERLMAERAALAEKYAALKAEAGEGEESAQRIAELDAEQQREEADYTRKLADSRRERYKDVYNVIVEFNAEELGLAEEQYDALLKLTENANSEEADAAKALLNFKKENLAETLELMQNHADDVAEVHSEALEKEAKDVEESQKTLLGLYKTYYDELAAKAKTDAEAEAASLQALKKVREAHWKEQLDGQKLQNEALEKMQKESSEQIIADLDTYTPGWREAGRTWGQALTGGVSEEVGKILGVIDGTVEEARKRLLQLEAQADLLEFQMLSVEQKEERIAELREKYDSGTITDDEMAELSKLYKDRDDRMAESMKESGKDAGNAFAEGLEEGLKEKEEDIAEAAEEAAKVLPNVSRETLEIRSPSRKGKEIGGFFAEGLAEGMEEKMERIRRASEKLSEEMTAITEKNASELRVKTAVQQMMTASVQTPDLIAALKGLEIKSIGYHQTNNFNGNTSPYQTARAVETAIRRALT